MLINLLKIVNNINILMNSTVIIYYFKISYINIVSYDTI